MKRKFLRLILFLLKYEMNCRDSIVDEKSIVGVMIVS